MQKEQKNESHLILPQCLSGGEHLCEYSFLLLLSLECLNNKKKNHYLMMKESIKILFTVKIA